MDERLIFAATQRNRACIGDVLSKFLPYSGSVLEVASGSGEHGVTFQERFPGLSWQTSDPNLSHRKSINAWIDHKRLTIKMPSPIDLDVEKRPWPLTSEFKSTLKCIVCINMIHISPWSCTEALIEESGNLLGKEQLLILYGPFKKNCNHTSKSNALFDQSLKDQNSKWGVRDLEKVSALANRNGFKEEDVLKMPANNLSIIYRML